MNRLLISCSPGLARFANNRSDFSIRGICARAARKVEIGSREKTAPASIAGIAPGRRYLPADDWADRLE